MPSTGVLVCDFCFFRVRFFVGSLFFGRICRVMNVEDEAFVFVQIWERTGAKEFKRFFCLADRRVSVSLLSMSF